MLKEEYQRIRQSHKKAIQAKAARLIIGPSVGRVFNKGTVHKIWPVLTKIDFETMAQLKSQEQYKRWFETQLNKLARKIKATNPKNSRIYPGYKWGHATKILCLFLNDMVVQRDFFPEKVANRLVTWLYCPIDSVVMKSLKRCNIKVPFDKIKEIDTPKKFYDIQDILGDAAKKAGVPRIWFDDNWGDRQ